MVSSHHLKLIFSFPDKQEIQVHLQFLTKQINNHFTALILSLIVFENLLYYILKCLVLEY